MIKRLLIANRGEIACRIIRTCRRLGVETVAVYSEADADALHTRSADQAVFIGPAAAADSYLNVPKILEAVAATGADAVHPGYGFLSENAGFVAALERADCTFVGPSAKTIKLMGSKADAKATMEAAGVPVVPGYHGEDQSDDTLSAQAERIGFPLMLKAAAGGGGKGMRIVRHRGQLADALGSARRESQGAFGDSRMILERYLETPRHLEVQVFGDGQGNVVHLFERDCSTQRRYQKVLEESPAPGLSQQQCEQLCQAGVDAAAAVGYRGAGTVEFIADASGQFFFMEMNTRLQVEHPVTELITGLDLVEWQLRVAAGQALPLAQEQIQRSGHALEARIYAEDPEQSFLPSSGTLSWLRFPARARVDTGFEQGDRVSVHYDPMIAKIICYSPSRRQTLAEMSRTLAETRLAGPRTNLAFLARLVKEPAFTSGAMHTALLDQSLPQPASDQHRHQHLLAAALTLDHASVGLQPTSSDPHSPWSHSSGWRLGQAGARRWLLEDSQGQLEILLRAADNHQIDVNIGQQPTLRLSHIQRSNHALGWQANGVYQQVIAERHGDLVHVASGRLISLVQRVDPNLSIADKASIERSVRAPMPGKIIAIAVTLGQSVSEGQELAVMEAMKMELSLKAPADGVIAAIHVASQAFVEADSCLLELDLEQTSGDPTANT